MTQYEQQLPGPPPFSITSLLHSLRGDISKLPALCDVHAFDTSFGQVC